MKTTLLFVLLLLGSMSIAQTKEKKTFFAQCALKNLSPEAYENLELQLKANTQVFIVRVDPISNTLFFLTQEMETFTATDFNSILGTFISNTSCINIGVRGVDLIKPNPKQDCNE